MSLSELLLTTIIALIVFGPNKLPRLAQHVGLLLNQIQHYKQLLLQFWETQNQHLQLQQNIEKAKKADELYNQTSHDRSK